jgi:hypothetical protein
VLELLGAGQNLGHDLGAVVEQFHQLGPDRLRNGRRTRPVGLAERLEHLGVDPVGLRQPAVGAGEITHPLGIDDGGRHAGLDQGVVQAAFAAARRLHHDQNVVAALAQRAQQGGQFGVALGSVGQTAADAAAG